MTGKELIEYLKGNGFKVFPDPNVMPDVEESQLPALFVFGTGGRESDDDLPIDYPTFQIIVKGKNYKSDVTQMEKTEQLAKSLIKLLDKKIGYVIGNNYIYHSKAMQSNPIPIGIDTLDRPVFSTNFRFKLQEGR
ncbi:minor capsid protein [Caldibacillus lycopersici]|uniref:Minor capsid protein n=1 Tax=Perspicuibacillus lycopersici TaxID=1325689 RepID=A0AAE3LTJ3_9BACI|nr:minor capsid protein [Perspicuibacillus lycopersici]MCU9614083.1 minor capsid protein [Perspicuibacillus lycopersici]